MVVCMGDFHHNVAGVLRPAFTDPASPVVAVEVVGGSVSSMNVTDALGRGLIPLARQLIPRVNPPIAYLDLKYHVYTKVVVTPEQMNVSYVAANTVSQPSPRRFLVAALHNSRWCLHP